VSLCVLGLPSQLRRLLGYGFDFRQEAFCAWNCFFNRESAQSGHNQNDLDPAVQVRIIYNARNNLGLIAGFSV
jgi:hypothetical protein